jgi:hypothetical protein
MQKIIKIFQFGKFQIWLYNGDKKEGARLMPKKIDLERFKQLYTTGLPDTQIAKKMGFTASTVWKFRQKLRLPANSPKNTFNYSLIKDYERVLDGEDPVNLISLHADSIAAFRKIEGRSMTMGDKVKKTGLSRHAIRALTRVYECHHVR